LWEAYSRQKGHGTTWYCGRHTDDSRADIEILGIVGGIQQAEGTDTELLGTVGSIQMIVGQILK